MLAIAMKCKLTLLTAATMMFFAANSLLARLALRAGEIDGGSFTAVRIFAGAMALALLVSVRSGGVATIRRSGSLPAAVGLFSYAILFSLAYVSLSAGTGALILFAAVQITMLGGVALRGARPQRREWIGLALAFGGLVYLVSPGLTAPSPIGVLLMAAAGAAWGYYSMASKGRGSPIDATAGNFARATPMSAAALIVAWGMGTVHASGLGLALAAISGCFTSGLGYVIWYTVLEDLPAARAAIVQLTVPMIAAAAGVLFLGETLTWRLGVASVVILGGVAWALSGRKSDRI